MNKKGISLVGIKDIETVKTIRERYPECWFELSYSSSEEELKEVLPLIEGRVASIHLLSPRREYFPNLASTRAYEWSEREIFKDAELALRIGAENLILHPGYLIDGLVYSDNDKRLEQIKKLDLRSYLIDKDNGICSHGYIESKEYCDKFKIMEENAMRLQAKISAMGLNLILENLNSREGYMVLSPDECIRLAEDGFELCLDIGHLEVNSYVFGFDLQQEAKRILDTGKVRSMHLHSNESRIGYYVDSHKSLYKYIPYWKELLQYASKKGSNLILEVKEEILANVDLLFR